MQKGKSTAMPKLTPQQRMFEINALIDNEVFGDDKLVYSFVLHLYRNQEIDECMDYVKKLFHFSETKYLIFYQLWHVSLLFLRGYCEQAKQEFLSLPMNDVPDGIKNFYLKKLGFDELYKNFTIEETVHFIFHIHPNRYKNPDDLRHKIERRELGYELVGKHFFGLSLERKIHYFLWDDADMKKHFSASHTCSCYGVIQEGEYNRDWHESTHVYNYLYGLENPKAFILEGIAVVHDGRKASVRLRYAREAYQKLGIKPSIFEWWQDPVKFRNTNSWIAYTTAGYFVLKLWRKCGNEKILQLAKYQTYEDACRIYGETELLDMIRETEQEIIDVEGLKINK